MSFWDSSALVPLLLPESTSKQMESFTMAERRPTIWWATPLECRIAIYRRRREGILSERDVTRALGRLQIVLEDSHTVGASAELRDRAYRVVANHPLRAADALQLAAALAWCEERPVGQSFFCLDDRLGEAARREGFTVLPA